MEPERHPEIAADVARRPAGPAFGRSTGIRLVGRYTLLGIVSFVVLFPVYTTVVAALKPADRVLKNPLVPDAFTLDILRDAWTEGRLGRFILNSLVVAVIVTISQVATSVMAGYAFAMLDFPVAVSCSWCSWPRCWCRWR